MPNNVMFGSGSINSVGGLIGVVILNWNGWRDTIRCAQSFLDATDVYVCIVDNASSDESLVHIEAWLAGADGPRPPSERFKLIKHNSNAGFAGGVNIGLRFLLLDSRIDFMWVINNDTVTDPQAALRLRAAAVQDPGVGIWGCRVEWFDAPGKIQVAGGCKYDFERARGIPNRDPTTPQNGAFDYIAGCSMFVPRTFLEDVGLMSENYFLYFEEIDWAWRATSRWRLAWVADAIVLHKEGASIGSSSFGRPTDLSLRYIMRNRLYFTRWRVPSQLRKVRAFLMFEVLVYAKRKDLRAVKIILIALWNDFAGRVRPPEQE